MNTHHPAGGGTREERGLGRTVLEDLKRAHLRRDFLQEIRDLYYFYLDEDARARLAEMGRLRRAFMLLGWLAKSLLLKLSPGRRVMIVLALAIAIYGQFQFSVRHIGNVDYDLRIWGFLVLLFVLMLELKDKLLAKDEIQIAREVQVALLPREEVDIPGWSVWNVSRPANDVGGDLVDYIELDGFRHGVLLGDVAGKGLGAALLSAKLQATLRALVPTAVSLDDLAAQANAIFVRDGLENRFATLFYAELEHHSGQVRYLNAGHNPAFAIQRDGVRKLGASALPLGMLPGSRYEECTLELSPGETLVAYSDGLTEAENEAREEFGEARLEALLTRLRDLEPATIGRRVLREVDRYLGEARPHDDLSLIIVRRERDR